MGGRFLIECDCSSSRTIKPPEVEAGDAVGGVVAVAGCPAFGHGAAPFPGQARPCEGTTGRRGTPNRRVTRDGGNRDFADYGDGWGNTEGTEDTEEGDRGGNPKVAHIRATGISRMAGWEEPKPCAVGRGRSHLLGWRRGEVVGVGRFELPTSRSRTEHSSLAELHPDGGGMVPDGVCSS